MQTHKLVKTPPEGSLMKIQGTSKPDSNNNKLYRAPKDGSSKNSLVQDRFLSNKRLGKLQYRMKTGYYSQTISSVCSNPI